MASEFLGIELTQRELIAALVLAVGAMTVLYGILTLFIREYRATRCATVSEPWQTNRSRMDCRAWVGTGLLVILVIGGALLRIDGLDSKTLTHTESYVPGLELPEDISWPPPRLTLYRTVSWHWHSETHPQGYYVLMWIWTKLFGTNLYSLRLPSVLFGVGSIVLIFFVATRMYDRTVGLLSAALLALNGFHIYWSQYARMYSMGCFLGLLSTLLLLQLARDPEKRRLLWESLYVTVSWLGVLTQIFFWPFLAAQILWAMLHRQEGNQPPRILSLQSLVVMLGSFSLTHAVYVGDDQTLPTPSLAFIQQFVSFGFLFEPDYYSIPARGLPAAAALLLVFLAIACAGRALSKPGRRIVLPAGAENLTVNRLLPVAAGSSLMILGLATIAYRRQPALALTSFVPILALLMPAALNHAWLSVQRRLAGIGKRLPVPTGLLSLPFMLAFVPFLIMVGLSFWVSVIASRPFLLFVPYLLVLIAVGVRSLSRRLVVAVPLATLLVVVHGSSIAYFRQFPTDKIDYQGLAQRMAAKIEPGDLIFVRRRDHVPTPIYYYLNGNKYDFIAEDFAGALSKRPGSRVWLLHFDSLHWGPYGTATEEMYAALVGFRLQEQVVTQRGRGVLYVRSTVSREP